LPEILSQWRQEFQRLLKRQEILATTIAQNFLTAIFHRRVVLKNIREAFDFESK